MMEKKHRIKDKLHMLPGIVIYILLQVTIIVLQIRQATMFNGVLSALQYGTCLLIVRSDRKRGVIVSSFLMGFTTIMLLMSIVAGGQISAVPGLCNMIFYIITMILLAVDNMRQEQQAITDYLTGVLNRRGLYKHLKERVKSDSEFSVVYFGIDNYKSINDNYGNVYGDNLLKTIVSRISECVKDKGVIARVGGTEFIAVIDGELDAKNATDEILQALRERVALDHDGVTVNVYVECYAGLATYPNDSKNYEEIIKFADISMIEALNTKSKEARVFDVKLAEQMNRQLEVEQLIKESLENDYFYMVYQPQYHLDGKKLRGFESLIRLKTPYGRMVSPGEFIPIAEKSDMIIQIDDYVLRRVMSEFSSIIKINPKLLVSINVSAKNIGDEGFVRKISEIILETQFSPRNLEIEITEYCMASEVEVTVNNIKELRNMGIQVALDDFGTGYTSLSNVANLPINLIKIDKSLIDDIEKNDTNRAFVFTVIAMGHLFGYEVLAEGVEEEGQLSRLKDDGCDFVQGYVWGKPMSYDALEEII